MNETAGLEIDKPKPIAQIRKTRPEVVQAVDELLETCTDRPCTDRQVAERLNECGYKNWKGQSFTFKKLIVIRKAYGLRGRYERLRARGLRTTEEMAQQLGVGPVTIGHWGRDGILRRQPYDNHHRYLYKPLDPAEPLPRKGAHKRKAAHATVRPTTLSLSLSRKGRGYLAYT
ncbi:MAG TPA: hypothetical protein VFA81_11330 [Burkholderiales bacterium]|nr:hypothetical protein [Burkholderiales bacterium]